MKNHYSIRKQRENTGYEIMSWPDQFLVEPVTVQKDIPTWEQAFTACLGWQKREAEQS